MPRGGHNKKSNSLQVLEGRDRADRHKESVEIKESFPVDPPDWLPEYAKLFWKKKAKILNDAGILTAADEAGFQVMALTYNTIIEAERAIDREGIIIVGDKGGQVKNPAVSVLNAARQQFRLQCQEYGLTPNSRERLGLQFEEEIDEMEKLLNLNCRD